MKKYTTTKWMWLMLFCFGSWLHSNAQVSTWELNWDRANANDFVRSSVQVSSSSSPYDGYIVTAGTIDDAVSSNSETDAYLSLINPSTGNTVWTNAYGWNDMDFIRSIVQVDDSTIAVWGDANRTSTATYAARDFWFFKLNLNDGSIISSSIFNSAGTAFATGTKIIKSVVTQNGLPTFLVSGWQSLTGSSSNHAAYIARLDWNGNIIWENKDHLGASNSQFNNLVEVPDSANPNNSRIFVIGNRGGNGGHGLVVEFNAAGQAQDAQTYQASEIFQSLNYRIVNQNIQLYVGGLHDFPSGQSSLHILNDNLGVINAYRYTLNNSATNHRLTALLNDANSNDFLAVFNNGTNRRTHIARMDMNGNISSVQRYDGASILGIMELSNGEHFLAGHRWINSQWDVFISRVDAQLTMSCSDSSITQRTSHTDNPTNRTFTDDFDPVTVDTLLPMMNIPTFNIYSACCEDFVVTTSSDTTICSGQSVTLTASATGNLGTVEYNWNTGETTPSIVVNPTTTTDYIVTVTDSLTQCSRTDTITVTVFEIPISITGDTAICEGSSTTLTADQTGYVSYLWSTNETTASITVNPMMTTTYTLTVTDANGCTNSTNHTVEVNTNPVAGYSGDRTVCLGQTVMITGTGGTTYQWDLLSGTNGNTVASTITGNPLTFVHAMGQGSFMNVNGQPIYRYVLTVTDENGCTDTEEFRIFGSNLSVDLVGDTAVCEGEDLQFMAIAVGGRRAPTAPYQFSWNGGADIAGISAGGSPIAEYTNFTLPMITTSGNVNVTVTDGFGCVASATMPYTIYPTPEVSLTASAASPICVGKPLTLTADYDEDAVSSISWSDNLGDDNINGNMVNVPTDFIGTTTYTVTIVDTNGCTNTTSIDVEVENCCWTGLSTDYVRLDVNYPDTRIADYNITQVGNMYYLQGDYQRLPERLYIATNATLVIESVSMSAPMTIADLTNSDVVFGEGAGIVVRNAELIANNAVFRPCNDIDTWDGIRIESTSDDYMTSVDVLESSFINATVALWYQNEADGSVADNTFSNCQFGVISTQATLPDAITNNIFKVDDVAISLTYSMHDNINTVGGFDGNLLDAPDFVVMNGRYFGYTTTSYTGNTIQDFAGIEILNPFSLENTFVDDALISQNDFVNAMSLADSSAAQFNGILVSNTIGLNISNNNFTNNSKSIIADNPTNISIENNTIEVTRRSAADEFNYQILGVGSGLAVGNLMIHNNTILNSADPIDLSAYIANSSFGDKLVEGSGAIYLANMTTQSGVHVTDNTIKGFEVGVYSTGASSSNHARIVGNDIQAHVYGVYVDEAATFGMGILVGCNQIDMDLDSDKTRWVRPVGVVGNKVNENLRVYSNCISNTANAIWYRNDGTEDDDDGSMNILPSTYNNYLNNYTDAGLLVEQYQGSVTFGSTNMSPTYGIPDQIGRNEFVSNFNGLDIDYSGSGILISNNNYYSGYLASVSGNVVVAGNPLMSYASCHGSEAQDLMADEMNNMDMLVYACDDEDLFAGYTTALESKSNDNIVLSNDYQVVLANLMTENTDVVVNTLMTTLRTLSNENEIVELFDAIDNLDLPIRDKQWLSVAYFQQINAPQQALATLNAIQANDETTADRIVIETAKLNRQIAGTATITNAADIEALKTVANRQGSYMHTARGLLNKSIGGFGFRYRTLPLPNTKSNENQTPNTVTELSNPIEIYPNPVSEQLFVNILEIGESPWTIASIVDLHGRVIATQQVTTDKLRFDVTDMPQGVYVLLISTENGSQSAQKFVKQ